LSRQHAAIAAERHQPAREILGFQFVVSGASIAPAPQHREGSGEKVAPHGL